MSLVVNAIVDTEVIEIIMKLDQIKLNDFMLLMRATRPGFINAERSRMTTAKWASLHLLVTTWQMDSYRDEILDIVTPTFTANSGACQIHNVETHNVKKWILSGIFKLVESPSPLTIADMKQLNVDLSAKIVEICEKNKVEAAVIKAVTQAEAKKWCKTTAPQRVGVFDALTSLPMMEEILDMSLRVQALARDYEKSVGDSMRI